MDEYCLLETNEERLNNPQIKLVSMKMSTKGIRMSFVVTNTELLDDLQLMVCDNLNNVCNYVVPHDSSFFVEVVPFSKESQLKLVVRNSTNTLFTKPFMMPASYIENFTPEPKVEKQIVAAPVKKERRIDLSVNVWAKEISQKALTNVLGVA